MPTDSGSILGALAFVFSARICPAVVGYYTLKFLYQIFYYRVFHALSEFPGPFWASVTRLYITFYNLKETEHEHMLDLHRKYGT